MCIGQDFEFFDMDNGYVVIDVSSFIEDLNNAD